MTADDRAAKLELYLDRLLAEPERARFDAALAGDPVLAGEVALARAIDGALLRTCAVPVGVGARVAQRLARPRRLRGALLLAAATVIAAVGAWFYVHTNPGRRPAPVADGAPPATPGDGRPLEACRVASAIETLLRERIAAATVACGVTLDIVGGTPVDENGFEKFEFRVDGKPVWLWIGADERAKSVHPPQTAGLRVFEGVLEGRRVIEVTPLDRPRVLQHLRIVQIDEPREQLRHIGYLGY